MIDLILDTNIWISYVAKDNPTGILDDLKSYIEDGEINLLANQIIVDEWNRNRDNTKETIANEIKGLTNSILAFKHLIPEGEIANFLKLLKTYKAVEEKRLEAAEARLRIIDELLANAEQTEITGKMKQTVADWALEKRAPFIKKSNSVGDALILLSVTQHRLKKKRTNPQGFFVTYNHKDYSELGDKDEIHTDLKVLMNNSNLTYKRYIGEVMNLAPDILMEIQNWIDYQVDLGKEMRRGL